MLNSADVRGKFFVRRVISKSLQSHLDWDLVRDHRYWPLLSIAHIVDGRIPTRGIRVVAVLCSIALAWLTYRYLEKKCDLVNRV